MLTIEFARRQKDLTQNELSMMTRIAAHFISLIENGRGIPTDEQARRLAEAVGVDPAQLLLPVPDLAQAERG